MNYIDLNKIKIAFFDFDNTLAIHLDKEYIQHRKEKGENTYYKEAFCNPDIFYEKIEKCTLSTDVYNLVAYLRLHNVKMYCLSGMKMSLHSKAKQAFISKHYGDDIELLSTGTQEGKVEVVKILQSTFNCKSDEILFVDDLPKVLKLMGKQGFQTVLANEVNQITVNGRNLAEILDD